MLSHPRIAPSDVVIGSFLVVVIGVFAITPAPTSAVLVHAGILAAFVIAIGIAASRPSATWSPWLRSIATVATLLTLYLTIWKPAFVAMGGGRDALLADIDQWLFGGHDPVLSVAARVTPFAVEFFSFIYGWFIPYIYLSTFLGCFGRPEEERRVFLFGLSLTYALSYLGYLFVPAHGPILHFEFARELQGGFFHGLVVSSIEAAGGPHGAFPSLHVGATIYLTLFDLRHNRLRGMTYVPVAILIAVATIVLRYHFVVDLIAGLLIASAGLYVAEKTRQLETTEEA